MIYQQHHSLMTDYFTAGSSKNVSFRPHMHSSFEVIGVTSGEMCVSVDHVDYTLSSGDVIFVFPYQMHSAFTRKESSDSHALFSSDIVSYFYRPIKGKLPKSPIINIKDDPTLDIFAKCNANDDITKIKGIMYLLCDKLSKSTEFVSKSGNARVELLDKIFSFINENYTDSCTLEDASKALKYDYSYLSKIFSEFVGMSFNHYINSLRVNDACNLLKNTDKSIILISEQCGFSSLRSFNRNFYQIIKMTPSEYREHEKK